MIAQGYEVRGPRELPVDFARRWVAGVSTSTGEAAAVFDARTLELLAVNDRFAAQLGMAAETLVGRSVAEITPEPDVPILRARVRHVLHADPQEFQWIRRFRRADESVFRAVAHVSGLRETSGEVMLIACRSQPIPPSDVGPAELVEQLVPLFETARDLLAVCGRDGLVRACAGGAGQVVRVGGRLVELFHAADRDAVSDMLRRDDRHLSTSRVALVNGTPVDVYVSALGDEVDTLVVRVAVTEDFDGQLRATNERLRSALEALDRIGEVVWATGLVEPPGAPAAVRTLPLAELTDRERRVVFALLRGQQIATIAKDLYVSPSTVRNYLSSVYAKLGVRSKLELIELLHDRT